MKNKFILVYGVAASFFLLGSILWFSFSVAAEAERGSSEAERTFSWISREAVLIALSDGFMTDSYIQKLTGICQNSRLLSAAVITTPSGTVFAWPKQSESIQYDIEGKPQITNKSLFMKVFSSNLDIGDGASGSVMITSVLFVLHPDTIFNASRNSFLVILSLLLITLIILLVQFPAGKNEEKESTNFSFTQYKATAESLVDDTAVSLDDDQLAEQDIFPNEEDLLAFKDIEMKNSDIDTSVPSGIPEGLFSPHTGIGWEQYLLDRLDAELIRAASSEQDLSLLIIRVSGLLHTDLLSRKISQVLLDTFKFRDLVFEFGSNGFAGILQNIHLDQAMKIADELYAGIDEILMELAYSGKITIGITTRTARLLPAARMIEEAVSAARKAVEEPSLPIVAFRANPEKYRNYVVEKA